ncbi:MAG: (deoxy)nucleoside triphosphate pyrophosphohydrolase [Bacteroidetes bacterium]|nr:(deoxy)nucleoside triphosphate pyrophosphohydrolase [Bacteroidota bacterium]
MAIPPESSKKIVVVPCAIFEKDGYVFSAQRKEGMSLALKWEFPGGKVDEGETEIEALHREIMEELSIEIEVGVRLNPAYKEDPNRIICLVPYVCRMLTSPIVLTEHQQYKWVRLEEVHKLDWAEADLEVIETFLHYLGVSKLRRHKAKLKC